MKLRCIDDPSGFYVHSEDYDESYELNDYVAAGKQVFAFSPAPDDQQQGSRPLAYFGPLPAKGDGAGGVVASYYAYAATPVRGAK